MCETWTCLCIFAWGEGGEYDSQVSGKLTRRIYISNQIIWDKWHNKTKCNEATCVIYGVYWYIACLQPTRATLAQKESVRCHLSYSDIESVWHIFSILESSFRQYQLHNSHILAPWNLFLWRAWNLIFQKSVRFFLGPYWLPLWLCLHAIF